MHSLRAAYDLASAPLIKRLDEIRQQFGSDPPYELRVERVELIAKWNDVGQELWEAFKEWSESLGYKPVKSEDVRKVLEGREDESD